MKASLLIRLISSSDREGQRLSVETDGRLSEIVELLAVFDKTRDKLLHEYFTGIKNDNKTRNP